MVTANTFPHGRCPLRAVPVQHCAWDPKQLSNFTFLMAGQGAPVRASMMLGDAGYARDQLRLACTFDDVSLQALAVEMLAAFTYGTSVAVSGSPWPQ